MPVIPYNKYPQTVWSGTNWQLVTPSDDDDLPFRPRAILVGTAGDVKMSDEDDTVTTVPSLVAGILHPFSPKRIYSTGTTAVGILICA